MQSLLLVNTSINSEKGHSSRLAQQFVEQLASKTALGIKTRDLMADNLPHLGAEEMQAWMVAPEARNARQRELAALSDQLIDEVKSSDIIVIGMPMYNFGVPSVFKAWIDRIARAGVTFKYTAQGPQGLIEGKKVYVVAARGGLYAGTAKDSQTQYLKDVLAFLGMSDVEFVYAEGLAMGPEAADRGFTQANEKMLELIEKQVA